MSILRVTLQIRSINNKTQISYTVKTRSNSSFCLCRVITISLLHTVSIKSPHNYPDRAHFICVIMIESKLKRRIPALQSGEARLESYVIFRTLRHFNEYSQALPCLLPSPTSFSLDPPQCVTSLSFHSSPSASNAVPIRIRVIVRLSGRLSVSQEYPCAYPVSTDDVLTLKS